MEVPTNPTRESAFVLICGSFLISANEIRVSRGLFLVWGSPRKLDYLWKRPKPMFLRAQNSARFAPYISRDLYSRPDSDTRPGMLLNVEHEELSQQTPVSS